MIRQMVRRLMGILAVALLAWALSCAAHRVGQKETAYFISWPSDCSPQQVGRRVAENFITRPHVSAASRTTPDHIAYPETCTWYGALTFAAATGDTALQKALIDRFAPLWTPGQSHLIPEANHVDFSVFGIVPLEIYIQNHDRRFLDLGQSIADQQWLNPTEQSLTPQTRYWIDDMYMITSLQTQAFRATGESRYLDRAALEMACYLDTLQQANGLFYHAPDAPFYWGRGNGWVAAGMTELLRSLPEDHPRRSRILSGYLNMMSALLRYQDENGMWHQLIDHADFWPESSCTAMFTFAFISGVKYGWLNEKQYGPAARKGWLALVKYLDASANIRQVCEGTGKRNELDWYLNRKRNTGDYHGQAPVLWCATALLR